MENKNMLKVLLAILAVCVVVFLIAFIGFSSMLKVKNDTTQNINSFEECAAAGYPIMESYPEQCKTPDGRNFVRVIESTVANFGSPITLTQTEKTATFSDGLLLTLVEINDSRCKPDVQCIWAGELRASLHIVGGKATTATEFGLGTTNNKSVMYAGYTFTLNSATETSTTITVSEKTEQAGCYVGGCSSEVCSDQKDAVSTCIFKEEFACYKTATCAKQTNGQCGWTQTPALTTCLDNAR